MLLSFLHQWQIHDLGFVTSIVALDLVAGFWSRTGAITRDWPALPKIILNGHGVPVLAKS